MAGKCYIDSGIQPTERPSYPTFLGFATEIMYLMIKMPDEETSKRMRDFLMGNSSDTIGDVVNQMTFSEKSPIIFWSIGFFLLFSAIVLFAVTTIIQYFLGGCEQEKPKVYETRYMSGYHSVTYLSICCLLMLLFVVMYDISQVYLTIEIDNSDKYLDEVSTKLDKVLTDGKNQLQCETQKYIDNNFDKFDVLKKDIKARIVNKTIYDIGWPALNNFETEGYVKDLNSGIAFESYITTQSSNTNCQNTINATKNITGNLKELLQLVKNVTAEKPKIPGILKAYEPAIQEVELDTNKKMIVAKRSIQTIFTTFYNMIDRAQSTSKKWIESAKTKRKDFVESFGYSFTKYFVEFVINIVSLIVMICLIMTAYLIHIRLRTEKASKKYLKFVLIGFYIAAVFTILLFIFWIFAFLGGWMISTTCLPIFEEDQYEFYKDITFQSPKFMKEVATIPAQQFLQRCNSDTTTTFFAIRGFEFFSATHVTKKFNIVQLRNMARNKIRDVNSPKLEFPTEIPRKKLINLEKDVANLKQLLNGTGCNSFPADYFSTLEKVIANSKAYLNLVDRFKIGDVTEQFVKNNHEIFEPLRVAISNSSDTFIHNLQYDIFKCGPFVHIFNTFGNYFCDNLGQPMHGFWFSLFLLSVAFLLSSCNLLYSYRWLSKPEYEFAKYDTPPRNDDYNFYGDEEPVNKTPESGSRKRKIDLKDEQTAHS